jgi:hypothetical protein
MKNNFQQRASNRRGAILPLVALLLTILLGCLAFAVDIAYIQLVKVELKSSADFSARAGGEALTRTQSLDEARAAVRNMASLNLVAGNPLLLEHADIIPGHAMISQSTGRWRFSANQTPFNSIRVVGRRTEQAPSGSVPLFYANLFGWDDIEVQRQTTVVRLDRDIVLVVDSSSSMKLPVDHPTGNMSTRDPRFPQPPLPDSRWIALESAVGEFVSALEETEQVEWLGLVSYASNYNRFGVQNTESEVNQTLTETHSLVNAEMGTISNTVFNGMTHISAGLDESVEALFDISSSRPFASKTIVLMTDGIPNHGSPQQVLDSAQTAVELNVKIYTITFGTAADQNLMSDIADIGAGEHYHATDVTELRAAFRKIALTIPLTFTE